MTDELRPVLLTLVRACMRSRQNAMAARMCLKAMETMTPAERSALRPEQIQAERKSAERQLAAQPDSAFVHIQQVLSSGGEFLDELRKFAEGLEW